MPKTEPQHVYASGREYIFKNKRYCKVFICFSINGKWFIVPGSGESEWPKSCASSWVWEAVEFDPMLYDRIVQLPLDESEHISWGQWLKHIIQAQELSVSQREDLIISQLELANQFVEMFYRSIPELYDKERMLFAVWARLTYDLIIYGWSDKELKRAVDMGAKVVEEKTKEGKKKYDYFAIIRTFSAKLHAWWKPKPTKFRPF